MVAHLGVRIHELLNEEIGNIIAENLPAWEKVKCYEEVANNSQHFFTLIQNNNIWLGKFTSLRESKMLRRGSPQFSAILYFHSKQYFFGFSDIYDITHGKIENYSFELKWGYVVGYPDLQIFFL